MSKKIHLNKKSQPHSNSAVRLGLYILLSLVLGSVDQPNTFVKNKKGKSINSGIRRKISIGNLNVEKHLNRIDSLEYFFYKNYYEKINDNLLTQKENIEIMNNLYSVLTIKKL